MTVFGALVMIGGFVYGLSAYANSKLNLMTPEIYLAGVAAIVGAILCVVGEVSRLRATIDSRIADQPEEEASTDSTKEE